MSEEETKFTCFICKAKNLNENEVVWLDNINENLTVCLECLLTSPEVEKILDKRKLKQFLKEWDKKRETRLYETVLGKGVKP